MSSLADDFAMSVLSYGQRASLAGMDPEGKPSDLASADLHQGNRLERFQIKFCRPYGIDAVFFRAAEAIWEASFSSRHRNLLAIIPLVILRMSDKLASISNRNFTGSATDC